MYDPGSGLRLGGREKRKAKKKHGKRKRKRKREAQYQVLNTGSTKRVRLFSRRIARFLADPFHGVSLADACWQSSLATDAPVCFL